MVTSKKQLSAQEGYKIGRKKGWTYCENCNLGLSFSDPSIIKEHVDGSGCAEFRQMFGMEKAPGPKRK